MKKENIKTNDNIEKLSKVLEEKKKIPKSIKEKINSKRFENIIFGVVIIVYLFALNLGMSNIPTENYLMDLKVFSVFLLIVTIFLFEVAYKKDISDYWFHGVEIMVCMIFTTYLIHLYSKFYNTFGTIIFSVSVLWIVYYTIKFLVMRKVIIKNYNKSLGDIGEIVKKWKKGDKKWKNAYY